MYDWGIRQGDVVAIISENCIEFPAMIFATIYLGAVAAPMNILYTKSKPLSFKLNDRPLNYEVLDSNVCSR